MVSLDDDRQAGYADLATAWLDVSGVASARGARAVFQRAVEADWFSLPGANAIQYVGTMRENDPSLRRSRCHILVVDDSEEIVTLLAEELERAGHVVATATDGVQALAVAEDAHPDLALVDLRLPRLSGWEVARRLRARFGPAILLAALTGWTTPGDRDRSTAAGFDRHLTKPASLRELRSLISAALARKALAPASP